MVHEDMDAAQELLAAARDNPDRVDWADLDPYLTHENNDVRARGAEAAAELVAADPESLFDVKSVLLELVEDEYIPVRQQALAAFDVVVPEYPEEFTENIDPFIDAFTSDIGTIRVLAANVFSEIARQYPEQLVPHIEPLLDVVADIPEEELPDLVSELQDPEQMETLKQHDLEERQKYNLVRKVAINGLVEVARNCPSAIEPHAKTVLATASDPDPTVAGASIDILTELVTQDCEIPEGTVPVIERQLDYESTFVQARAVRALGHLGATDAADSIDELGTETDDENLRELAEETAEWLRSQAEGV